MFTTRVKPNDIENLRIEAEYYQPEKMRNIAKLKNVCKKFVALSELCEFITDGTHQTPTYVEDGVKFLSSKNIGVCEIDFDDTKFVTKDAFDELKRTKCSPIPGDILISKNGKIGTACVYKDTHPSVGLFVSVALLRYRSDIDSDFLAMYLNSNGGWWQFSRSSKTGVITNLHLEEIREVEVPVLDHSVQKYIGDKVRQAERLRAWAGRAQEKAVREMPAYKPMISHYEKSSYRVSTDSLLSARLDSSFFHPDHRALDRKMKESGCKYLGKVASSVKPGWNKKSSDSFLYYEIGGLNVSNGTIAPVVTLITEAPSRATTAVKQGDVLVSTVRPNRKNVGFVIEDIQDMPMVATSGFSVLRFESLIEAAFYHAWLRTDDATSQLMRWNSGSAYPAIDEDVPLKILVPEFDVSLRARLGQILLDTHFALLHSAKLINAAKLLVEALIEGQLTEAELSAAEQALQAGNDQLDRRILNRLKTDGIDGQGPALFGDLDELYHLLTQAKED